MSLLVSLALLTSPVIAVPTSPPLVPAQVKQDKPQREEKSAEERPKKRAKSPTSKGSGTLCRSDGVALRCGLIRGVDTPLS